MLIKNNCYNNKLRLKLISFAMKYIFISSVWESVAQFLLNFTDNQFFWFE